MGNGVVRSPRDIRTTFQLFNDTVAVRCALCFFGGTEDGEKRLKMALLLFSRRIRGSRHAFAREFSRGSRRRGGTREIMGFLSGEGLILIFLIEKVKANDHQNQRQSQFYTKHDRYVDQNRSIDKFFYYTSTPHYLIVKKNIFQAFFKF